MPRYVILEHDHPLVHWDFMLESGDILRTWRLASPPAPARSIEATEIGNHRKLYLDYEGPVSGNRGKVIRWECGEFSWKINQPDQVAVALHGDRLQGTAVVTRVNAAAWSFELLT